MAITDNLLFTGGLFRTIVISFIASLLLVFKEPLNEIYNHLHLRTVKAIGSALAVSQLVAFISNLQGPTLYTSLVYALEGSAVALFQSFTHPVLTTFLIFAYMVAYPVLTLLTYFKLHSFENGSELKFAGSYVLLTAMAAPFFYFIPVEVTGYYLEGVKPLLYEFHPIFYQWFTSFDPLTKALPSLHAGISMLSVFYAWKYAKLYRFVAGFVTLTIIFSTFYLGIHWITDAVIGTIMAFAAFYLVDTGRITSDILPDRVADKGKDVLLNLPQLVKKLN